MTNTDVTDYVWVGQNGQGLTFENLGKTMQVNDDGGGYLAAWETNGELRLSTLLQYHMHAPSEHTVDGYLFDLEFHFVHYMVDPDDGKTVLSVLGVFFDQEKGGTCENKFLKSLTDQAADTVITEIDVESLIYDLDNSNYY